MLIARQLRLDFLGIGVQKGGTTSLSAYLRRHEGIVVPDRELHFFDNESLDWSQPPVASYHRDVRQVETSDAGGDHSGSMSGGSLPVLHGEVTPIYIYWSPCAERIYRYNPSIKLIVLLRNPLARAFSHWAMELERGLEDLPFGEAIRQEDQRCQTLAGSQHRVYSYLDRGRYAVQLQRLFHFFPRSQVLVLRSEDLFTAPTETLRQLTDFLGVHPMTQLEPIHARQGLYSHGLHRKDWEMMAARLDPDITALEALLGWDCDLWREPWMPLD